MANFPAYAKLLTDGYSEDFDPSILRTEMERGVPKQRLLNSRVMQELNCTILFSSAADLASFETWYFDTIKRIGWFDFVHPRTRTTVSGRFKEARIGAVQQISPAFGHATRTCTIEYLR